MSIVSRVARTVRAVISDVRRPPWVAPGHFYSPRVSPSDVARAIDGKRQPVGIDVREEEQLAFAQQLGLETPPARRWTTVGNTMFGPADAAIYRAVLLHVRPRRVVEIGSGYSTAVALDVADDELPHLTITCIEPYADRLRGLLQPGDESRLTLDERAAQDLTPTDLVAGVGPGDVFFIDSTHVAKSGSDVCHLLLHTVPLLPVGALVHVHDVFWPFEYPDAWLREGRDWTEIYLLQAFLIGNRDWRIMLFGSWLWQEHPELVPLELRDQQPGSIWLERVA